jgi:hypothetical protein
MSTGRTRATEDRRFDVMRSALVRTIALLVVVALGGVAWSAGITRRFFDYDEIYHAHATWLIARGYRPFHDFQASHLPFLWYPLAMVWWIRPDSPATLLPLRVVAAVGTALSLMFIMANARTLRNDLPTAWMVAGVAPVAFNRDVLDFGVEFRPDSWSTALLFCGFFLLLTARPASTRLRCFTFGALAGLAVLASPKFFILPVLFALLDLVGRIRRRDDPGGALIGYAFGVAASALLAIAFLRAAGVNPRLAFQMAISYQLAIIEHAGSHRGLLHSMIQRPQLSLLIASGVAAWAGHLFSTRRMPHAYELAVVLFLATQLLIVDRPYKQYYGPWFLLAASFVPFIGTFLERTSTRAASWCFFLAIVLSAWTAGSALRSFSRQDQAHQMLAFYDRMIELSPADAPIAAYPPLHPIVRRDVFYGWSRTIDPGGYGTEAIMRDLDIPGYSARFDRDHYRQELDSNPPALVVSALDDEWAYEPAQWAALREYLATHRDDYAFIDRGLLRPVWVRRR